MTQGPYRGPNLVSYNPQCTSMPFVCLCIANFGNPKSPAWRIVVVEVFRGEWPTQLDCGFASRGEELHARRGDASSCSQAWTQPKQPGNVQHCRNSIAATSPEEGTNPTSDAKLEYSNYSYVVYSPNSRYAAHLQHVFDGADATLETVENLDFKARIPGIMFDIDNTLAYTGRESDWILTTGCRWAEQLVASAEVSMTPTSWAKLLQ